jgi:hypothetical protein
MSFIVTTFKYSCSSQGFTYLRNTEKKIKRALKSALSFERLACNKAFVIVPSALGRFRAPQYWRYVRNYDH